jgi:hypothetical protein
VPAAVWRDEGVAEAEGATLAVDRVAGGSRSGLAAANVRGRPELAAADGLCRPALSSVLVLIVAPVSC